MILTKELSQVTLEKCDEGVTGKTGLSFIYHSMQDFGLPNWINQCFGPKKCNREVSAEHKIWASVLTSIAGGECVEDNEILRADTALVASLGWESMVGADALRNWMKIKRTGARLRQINDKITLESMKRSSLNAFTYDNDATYFESNKECAAYSYHKEKEFSGLLGFIPELGICNTVDFRPGNISPCTGVFNQLRKATKQAKSVGKQISRCRIDSAGHQEAIFNYCNDNHIKYFISLKKNTAVQECISAVDAKRWQKLKKDQHKQDSDVEYAEGVYVCGKTTMRILILRWANPSPTLFKQNPYCYHVIATNDDDIKAMEWLTFHNGRMGSENYNKELKYGFNSDYAPSHDFNQNRAYFILKVLAYNVVQIMKQFYLGETAERWSIKTLRYKFINVCGRIVNHARTVTWKIINVTDQTFQLYRSCMKQLVFSG